VDFGSHSRKIRLCKYLILRGDLVGASGFELPTSWSRTKKLRKINSLAVSTAIATHCFFLPLNGLVVKSRRRVATPRNASMQKPGIVLGIVRQSKFSPQLVEIPLW
jgi:hypothetical protein